MTNPFEYEGRTFKELDLANKRGKPVTFFKKANRSQARRVLLDKIGIKDLPCGEKEITLWCIDQVTRKHFKAINKIDKDGKPMFCIFDDAK